MVHFNLHVYCDAVKFSYLGDSQLDIFLSFARYHSVNTHYKLKYYRGYYLSSKWCGTTTFYLIGLAKGTVSGLVLIQDTAGYNLSRTKKRHKWCWSFDLIKTQLSV